MRGLSLTTLLRDRRGVVSVYFAAIVTAVALLLLAGLDMMRLGLLRSRLQAALDAAVLAAGYNLAAPEAEWKAEATAYFNANMAENMLGGSVTAPTFAITTDALGTHVSMTATATVPLMVSAFTDMGAIGMSLTTRARKRTRANVEMVLAIDNTGSMGDDGKMEAARTAAKQVVATMLGDHAGGNTYVGLVPFNETVRVGNTTLTRTWLAGEPGYDTSKWHGCLFERTNAAGAYAVERDTPATRKFRAYRDTIGWDYERERRRGGATACWPEGDHDTECEYVGHKSSELTSQNGCVAAPVNFLTSSKATLDAAIDAMDAGGSTMVAAGVMWGWRMLVPSWRGWWEANSALPKDQGTGLNKVLVLLTDGDNEVYRGSGGSGTFNFRSPYGNARVTNPWGDLTGKNNISADNLLWNDPAGVGSITSYCEAVKADKITIYTIPFGRGDTISTNTERILKGCASDADKYFRVTATTDLAAAFRTITDSLSELVIEQ